MLYSRCSILLRAPDHHRCRCLAVWGNALWAVAGRQSFWQYIQNSHSNRSRTDIRSTCSHRSPGSNTCTGKNTPNFTHRLFALASCWCNRPECAGPSHLRIRMYETCRSVRYNADRLGSRCAIRQTRSWPSGSLHCWCRIRSCCYRCLLHWVRSDRFLRKCTL